MTPLSRAFFDRATAAVARGLLGQRLVRALDGVRLAGLICETEAYGGSDDMASHAFRRTPRSAIMYGPPGYAYVYFIYGMHHCLNVVTEGDGQPGAVLIRGIVPEEGIEALRIRRGGVDDTVALNGVDLTTSAELFIEPGAIVPDAEVAITPRVGVRGNVAALDRPWRFVWQHPENCQTAVKAV
ncbi:MAG: DNA-3-methyladenine glycosylase [Verrucomicrobia bacterium]|nr:DNA-3-methyladenine glycosylase [Verrucomicrobiota bacterium]